MAISRGINKDKDLCFVIMPFGGWLDHYFKTIYIPAIKAAGLNPLRADDIYRPSAIVPDIWEQTKKAKLLIADLSGKNPNVFYELGLAHAITKPVIFITDNIEDVPFDLRALRIIEYDRNLPTWGADLKLKITAYIKEVLKDPNKAVPANFLDREHISINTISSKEKNKLAEEQESKLMELEKQYDLLRRQMMHRFRYMEDRNFSGHPSPSVSPSISRFPLATARRIIDEYISRRMPDELIIERLSSQGIPSHWIIERLRESKRK
jgi:hypothetical protein